MSVFSNPKINKNPNSELPTIRVLLAERISTDEIDTEGVPWNVLDILLDGNLPALEMALLEVHYLDFCYFWI